MRRRLTALGLVFTGIMLGAQHAQAANGTWTQTVGGAQSWATGANWSNGIAPNPGSGDTIDFSTVNIAADTTVTLGSDRTATTWLFGDTSGAQNWIINSGNTMVLAGTPAKINVVQNTVTFSNIVNGATVDLLKSGKGTSVFAGASASCGALSIDGGGMLALSTGIKMTSSGAVNIGSNTVQNSMAVSGNGTLWDCGSSQLILGTQVGAHSNSLTIANGAVVTNVGGTHMQIGYRGSYNSLAITNGGKLYANPTTASALGYLNSSIKSNTVFVAGIGSLWDNGGAALYVGYNGSPSNALSITDGGVVTNVSGALQIGTAGGSGNGLVISNGGKLYTSTTTYTAIGPSGGSGNYVLVTGNGSLWDAGGKNMTIGSVTAGGLSNFLSISSGGMVSNVSGLTVGQGGAGNALVMDQGNLNAVKLILATNTAYATLRNGSIVTVQNIALSNGAALNLNGVTLVCAASTNLISGAGAATGVYVQDGGVAIDTHGYSVTNSASLLAGGAGGLTKLGTGTLILSGTNTYTGATVAQAGVLELSRTNALSSATALDIRSGAEVRLSFTGTNVVYSLTVNGITKSRGVYAAGSVAGLTGTAGAYLQTLQPPPRGTMVRFF